MIIRYAVGVCIYEQSRLFCYPTDAEFGLVIVVGLWHKGISSHLTTATPTQFRGQYIKVSRQGNGSQPKAKQNV